MLTTTLKVPGTFLRDARVVYVANEAGDRRRQQRPAVAPAAETAATETASGPDSTLAFNMVSCVNALAHPADDLLPCSRTGACSKMRHPIASD